MQALKYGDNEETKKTKVVLDSDQFTGYTRSIVKYLSEALADLYKQKSSKGSNKRIRSRSDEVLNRQQEVETLVSTLQDCSKSFNAELLYCVCELGQEKLEQAEFIAYTERPSVAKSSFLENLAILVNLTQSLRFMLRQRSQI